MSQYLKIVIDWRAIAKTINKDRDRKLTPYYLKSVYTGMHVSHDISLKLKELFEKELSKPIRVNPKTLIKEEV